MFTSFTSGAARRNAIGALTAHTTLPMDRPIAAVNSEYALTGLINPILDAFRDADFGYDAVFEWLFQLGHLWPTWMEGAPFPVEGWMSLTGPTEYDESQRTGEDAAYWLIDEALRDYVATLDGIEITDYDDRTWGFRVITGHLLLRRVEVCDQVAARIRHATAVLARLLHQFEED